MGALVPFAFDDALVRVIEIDGSHWWVAADVAKILGYRTFHMVRMLDDDEQGIHNVDGLEGTRRVSCEVSIISESGVFHAIFNSRRGEAERFRKWVTNEVLPALRREGVYRMPGHEEGAGFEARLTRIEQRMDSLARLLSGRAMIETPEFARALTYAPPVFRYTNEAGAVRPQRYPKWYFDLPVREAVVAIHRQMTLDRAVASLTETFGKDRAPTRSSLGRFWKASLDPLMGIATAPTPKGIKGQ